VPMYSRVWGISSRVVQGAVPIICLIMHFSEKTGVDEEMMRETMRRMTQGDGLPKILKKTTSKLQLTPAQQARGSAAFGDCRFPRLPA
jgi:hypothetical protein